MLARRRALPLPEFSGAPADRIVDPVERDQPGVQQVQVAVEAIPLQSFYAALPSTTSGCVEKV
jgi:hypothetical protein